MITPAAVFGFLGLLAPLPFGSGISDQESSSCIPSDGNRVVVIGDSITQAGDYVVYVEAYLLTRFPDRQITVINHGLSSETAAGTSEPDHPFPRPWIHDRFDRDVTKWNPDRVVACYGMNDGIYHPFAPERFEAYQRGILLLIDRTRTDTTARIDLLTPPPYDPYRRQVGDPDAREFGYRFPVVNYDEVLARYAAWLRSLADENQLVGDANSALTEHVEARRVDRVSYSIMPDGIHPNPTGHWLIAQTLLKAWNAPATVAEVFLDASTLNTSSNQIQQIERSEGIVAFHWKSPLPMPIDPRCDPESIRLEQVADLLNRYRLTVTGLEEGRYRLLAAESGTGQPAPMTVVTAAELAEGIDLTTLPDFPTVLAAQEVLQALAFHRSAQARAWRESIKDGGPPDIPPPGEDDDLMQPIRELCQPRELLIRIEPVADQAP
ncbi:SGNH/GDSL hydrolase family protein [Tautonia rosea]|uniref:SGNH/GDSL hydrolase family protein n=1 Tax=Tautonia rosea TaxID=2728037 RepID=UPI001472CE46|nr:SGNH/GDSL hydrolase family protein [Tautonia rosea]